uniref:Si:ch211-215c18.3 n=2 Tax=Cyprinus carpio TaxID=7962 RepID=A0A8C1CRM3_CYPCA
MKNAQKYYLILFNTKILFYYLIYTEIYIFKNTFYSKMNLRVDCEFPETHKIPGPFCEFKQDGRLMGSTYPNTPVHMIPPIETRRRANVTLVAPNICRLTWMPMSDDRSLFTCSIFVSLFQTGNLLVCSALTIFYHTGPWILAVVISLPVSLGLLHRGG